MTRTAPLTPYFVLIGAQFAVGSAALMARAGLGAGLSAPALSAWRLTVAATLLTAILNATARRRGAKSGLKLDTGVKGRLIIAGVCLGLHFATWFASLQAIPVARSTLLVATTPIFAGLAGVLLLRHRLPATFWAGLVLALFGVWLVTAAGSPHPLRPHPLPLSLKGRGEMWGDGMAVLGAIFIAAYLLIVQDIQARIGTWRLIAWTYSAAALSLWPLALTTGAPASFYPAFPTAWLSIFGLALVPQLLGHTAINWSLRRFPAGAVAASTLLEPVFAAALAWWLLGEPLTGWQAFGAAILLGGVALSLRHTRLPVEESL